MRRPDKDQFAAIIAAFAKAKQERFWLDVNITKEQREKMMSDFYGDIPRLSDGIPHIAFNMAINFFCRIMDVKDLPEKYQRVIPEYVLAMDGECKANIKVAGYSVRTPNDLYNLIIKNYNNGDHHE